MNFRKYLATTGAAEIQFGEIPPEQRATEESLMHLEEIIAARMKENEDMLNRSEALAALSALN